MTKRRRLHEKPSDSKLSRKRRSAQTLFHDSTNHVATMTTSNATTKSPRSRVAFLTPTLRSVWLFSCGLRVAWTIYGQNGYIHPDEFFQGPEVVAGDVLGLKVTKTWEFTSEPIRSMLPPSATIGIPYISLLLLKKWHDLDLINSYTLVMVPRLTYCLLSFIIDFCLWRISSLCKLPTYSVLTAFSTSYIALVFYTRTLSNTLEAVFFALLLLVVISTRTKNMLATSSKSDAGRTTASTPSPSFLTSPFDPFDGVFSISLILVAGFFNRPTFLAFAVVPFVFWLFDSFWPLGHQLTRHLVVVRLVCLFPGCFLMAGVFVLFDSLYYGSLTGDQILRIFQDPNTKDLFNLGFVITPLNFIFYNLDSTNLASHGRHPFYTHLFNSFLLYGVIAVLFFVSVYHKYQWSSSTSSSSSSSSSSRSQSNLLTFSYLFPLVFLSLFAHQEPRFLIPLLAPLCLLHSELLFGAKASRLLAFTWFFWGVLGAVLFGVLHQGGVVPSLTYLSNVIRDGNNLEGDGTGQVTLACPTKILYYKTYMPPHHLLALNSELSTNDSRCDDVRLIDLKGCSQSVLTSALRDVKREAESGGDVVFVAPTSVVNDALCRRGVKLNLIGTFFPHLSMETPPGLASIMAPADGEEEEEEEEDDEPELTESECRLLKNSRRCTFFERIKLAFSVSAVKIDVSSLD